MQRTPSDDEIRAHSAFHRVVAVYRRGNIIFWAGLPFFAIAAIYAVVEQRPWAFAVAGVLAVGNIAGQLYGLRQARHAASDISVSPEVQGRAVQLARDETKLRLPRWFPGA